MINIQNKYEKMFLRFYLQYNQGPEVVRPNALLILVQNWLKSVIKVKLFEEIVEKGSSADICIKKETRSFRNSSSLVKVTCTFWLVMPFYFKCLRFFELLRNSSIYLFSSYFFLFHFPFYGKLGPFLAKALGTHSMTIAKFVTTYM